jgi:hypothetical protein
MSPTRLVATIVEVATPISRATCCQEIPRVRRCVESGSIKPMPHESTHFDPHDRGKVKNSVMVELMAQD